MATPAAQSTSILHGQQIFLSASFPVDERRAEYAALPDPVEITDAVVAVTRAVLTAGAKLVYGGHPAISPLILSVATEFTGYRTDMPFIIIYQSRRYADRITPHIRELAATGAGEIVMVDGDLEAMRHKMLDSELAAAIFIGGMQGIADEFDLFRKRHEHAPVYCFGAPGGRAADLASAIATEGDHKGFTYAAVQPRQLVESRRYPLLCRDIIIDVASHLKPNGSPQR